MEQVRVNKITRKLADGSTRDYFYEIRYTKKNDQRHKTEMYELIRGCNDTEKLGQMYKSINDILNNQVKEDKIENNND